VTAIRNIAAIVQKEWRHYFGSPIAWVALFVWTLLFGIFFYFAFTFFLEQSMRVAQQGMEYGGGVKLSLNEYLIRPLFHNMAVVALFVAPMLTMRLFAEERRQGTIELLATSPITDVQIVVGKFLAAAGLYLLMILAGLVNVAGIWLYASNPPEWKPVVTGALGIFLLGSCFLAMGAFVSTLTRNQIVASSSGCGRSAGRTTRWRAPSARSSPTWG
jgi:ABC-2 type transport system permease protein